MFIDHAKIIIKAGDGGDGCVSFDHTLNVLDKVGYEGWLVVEAEQDPAKANPFEYALKARSFIREKAGI